MKIWLVAGEDSGDQLGAKLMASLHEAAGRPVTFGGVGGEAMTARGLTSLFPLDDVAVMGYLPVLARLRTLLRRIRQTVDDVVANRPDVLVIIDSPGFTHAVASRVRKRAPEIPIVDYVSPSVWAWRPWRAASMRGFVDHVLALLPFEPEAHLRLNGPPCTYVGHPLIERFSELRPDAADAASREAVPWRVVVLPGSRRSEIERLMPVFGRTLARMARDVGPIEAVLPAVTRHRALIERMAKAWSAPVRIVAGEAEKYAAFRQARAALAASGTVTLELALAGVPMVVAYKVSRVEEAVARRLIQVPTIVLPNLILGENAMPEFVQAECTEDRLATALAPLVTGGAARDRQLAALQRIDGLMRLPGDEAPSRSAARVVLAAIRT
ncbi:lipid-A-disaccharide synthase [Methylobacterium sp. E-041]|jgi:lipid-A-disaccharide synthase|uniref:lipid-A-disaccharide synthase n=1 Tax=unclassified Methylobacterium TaxID=2615210 RepID=UPI0011C99025|nr:MULTISPECIES: lipid-A-disaccharide synthase [unclassified Methylobacterium]MCJ2040205.1 lipid-A-disaccharide synthase [Methylobacterium sp. J-059]MCJ2109163.1 lipid-A-disaccharide synthase [Methylobacterium sp. E-041]TXM90188.1 lipid-A-disaccharide synthase [Methylobacterium sp. WL116]TXN38531.1 lipid-A-disaccharide synthase [Methylobacterium sp. WL93]TXN50500.1 lipid-A-disaccharide synthase [Methylobacterium sp. WL119]